MSEYISISPTTGTGNKVITATTLDYNISGENILGRIDITNGIVSKTVNVKQKYQPVMQQFASSTFPATGGSIYCTVKSEYDVVFRSVPLWIRIFDSSTGTEYVEGQRIAAGTFSATTTLRLEAEANTSTTERTVGSTFNMAHYINNSLSNRVSYFHFTQDGTAPRKEISVYPILVTVASAVTSTTIQYFELNCTIDHVNGSTAGTFTITAGTPNNGNLPLYFPANTGRERRGYITLYFYDTDGDSYSTTVTIVQQEAAYRPIITINPTALTFDSYEMSTQTAVVTSNGPFSASVTDSAYFAVTPSTGASGTTTLYIMTLSANTSTSPRTSTVLVTSTSGSPTVSKSIMLTQTGQTTPVTSDTVDVYITVQGLRAYGGDFQMFLSLTSDNGYSSSTGKTYYADNYGENMSLAIHYVGEQTQLLLSIGVNRYCSCIITYGANPSVTYALQQGMNTYNFNFEHNAHFTLEFIMQGSV